MRRAMIGFDVTLLAHASKTRFGGGGVARVTREIAASLVEIPEVEIRLGTFLGPRWIQEAKLALARGEPKIGPSAMAPAGGQEWIFRFLNKFADDPSRRIDKFLLRFVLRRCRNLLDENWGLRGFDGCDLLHSPFFPIPPKLRNKSRTLLSVMDMIPLRVPQFCDPNFIAWFKKELIPSMGVRDWIHCISESARKDLLQERPDLDPNRVRVVPLAASSRFAPISSAQMDGRMRDRLGIPPGIDYFLSLSTLEGRKNLEGVIRAFLLACKDSRFKSHLVLAGGSGWKTEQIERALQGAGEQAHRIHSTGFVDDSLLPCLYSGAKGFVFLSRYEGFGLPVLEAMACGVPVVASNNSSIPEVVGDAGCLVHCEDVESAAERILVLDSDSSYRGELSAKSLRRAALFSWQNTANELRQLYREILESPA